MIERLRGDCHLAAGTVEVEGEALAVVEEEERTAGRSSLMDRAPSLAAFGRMSKALQLEIRVSCAFDHPVKGEFFERVGAEIAKPHCGHTQYGRGERLNLGLS